MPGKKGKGKKGSKGKKKKSSRKNGGGGGGNGGGGGGGSRSAKGRCNVDVFSEAAMENAYYTCHNVQDVLKIRGFPWPEASKKKKGKKGKGKK